MAETQRKATTRKASFYKMTGADQLEIRFTHHYAEAVRLRDNGYEPIECAFGQHGSVLGALQMDHHGLESHREGVAIRACRDHYGARQADPRFVVTGSPDADAVLAIIGLAGLVPKNMLQPSLYELVDAHDRDPIGMNLLASADGLKLMWFNQLTGLVQSEGGFRVAIDQMCTLLEDRLSPEVLQAVSKADRGRRRAAWRGIVACYDEAGNSLKPPEGDDDAPVVRGAQAIEHPVRAMVVNSAVWGFDQWYRIAPIVVSYSTRLEKVTIGCPDESTAKVLLGSNGLMAVWAQLGKGWGGRPSIGGSPRGEPFTLKDAHGAAHVVVRIASNHLAASPEDH
ncbi:MAG: hypothetical protein VX589_19985 [Myxococcota bacterium]|nr:hypothetical protein [Myxococcota bacterium]